MNLDEIEAKIIERFTDGKGQCMVLRDSGFGLTKYCLYIREDDGNRCAIGYLVDEETARAFEDNGFGDIGTGLAEGFPLIPQWMKAYENLLIELQMLHDDETNWGTNGKVRANTIRHVKDLFTRERAIAERNAQ